MGGTEPNYITVAGSYVIQAEDHGAVISNAGASESTNLSVAVGLPAGFQVTILVEAAQTITFYGGATVHPIENATMSGFQDASAILTKGTSDWYGYLSEGGWTTGS